MFKADELRGHDGRWIKGGSTLNVGLHVGDPAHGGRVMQDKEVLDTIRKAGGEVTKVSHHTSDTEPTMVISLKRGFSPSHLHNLSADLHQDAIAQRRNEGGGDLAGPKAAEWGGEYNPDYFLMHSGKTASEEGKNMSLSIITPAVHDSEFDLSREADGRFAFWKQILPMQQIHYTAKDGSRQTANFDEQYLTDLAKMDGIDKIGFLLADKDNGHTMDPERWRGDVVAMEVRHGEKPGLYGKIVFPNATAAAAVLANPDLGVSARIREGIQRSDGSTVGRGIIHVLGTLDPQVSGMTPWESTDLSTSDDEVLDLSNESYEDIMATKKKLSDFTEADIDAMSEDELDALLEGLIPDFEATLDFEDETDEEVEDNLEEHEDEKVLVGAGADMSNVQRDIELANGRAAHAERQAREALAQLAEAKWDKERESLLGMGVPPHMLDLAAPVMSRAGGDMVIDLSNTDQEDMNVTAIVRGLLEGAKGMIDLSVEQGHGAAFNPKDDTDPDAALLAEWDAQS